jgi:serralysin
MSEAKGSQLAWDNSIAPRYEAMSGNNQLSGIGKNIMLGGVGDDDYRVDNQQDIIIEKADSGTDNVSSAVSLTLPENVENLTLQNKTGGISPFNFTQNLNGTGNVQNNILDGNDAKNILKGLGGNDLLKGEKGNDTLIGGLGRDVLNGGAGADTFKFNAVNESSPTNKNCDVIIDFTSTDKDKIDLSTIDANITTTVNDTFLMLDLGINDRVFKLTNALYFNTTTHILYGNNDADKAADFSIVLSGVTTLELLRQNKII